MKIKNKVSVTLSIKKCILEKICDGNEKNNILIYHHSGFYLFFL